MKHIPRWNPINVCPYHLQEAGATPVQELAYGLATAVGVLDAVRDSGQVSPEDFPEVVGRISFFIDAGIRFVEEMCKMRAFTQLWDRICLERYGVQDEKLRRFRYGVQVNSLGLTEAQPENNVQRIVLEMLGVTLSRDARARALQLPCWNEALGLPRPWDQQWSLRMQQVLAYETDLLEYGDLFEGSKVVEAKVEELSTAAWEELQWVLDGGGAFEMIDEIKGRLVQSNAERIRRIESGETKVVGVNSFTETEASPLTADLEGESHILVLDPAAEAEQIAQLEAWRTERDSAAVELALKRLRAAAATDENLMAATIELARAGGTVGEWAGALRDVFGEYRAPDRRRRDRGRRGRRHARGARPTSRPRPGRSAARPGSSSASPASTATRTAPSRSPWRPRRRDGGRLPGHPAHPGADRGRRATRTSTSSASRSCPARTSSWSPRRSDCCGPWTSTRRSWSAASSPRPIRSCSERPAWPGSTHRRTTGSRRSWRIWPSSRWNIGETAQSTPPRRGEPMDSP